MQLPVKAQAPETVILQKGKMGKGSYGLRLGTRIFIQDVQPGSLADQKGLKRGDLVLAINGSAVDNKTVNESISLISSGKQNALALVVQKQDGGTVTIPASLSRPGSRRPSRSPTPSRSRSPTPERKPEESPEPPVRTSKPYGVPENAIALPSIAHQVQAAPPRQTIPNYSDYQDATAVRSSPNPIALTDDKPRQIVFIKAKNVGIRLAGGNDVGIFVASVQEGSPAAQQGLRMGDQILEVNGQNFRQLTREDAVLCLMGLPMGSEVSVVAQSKPRHYESILERGTGDSFYIRTHFKYESTQPHELSFKKGSVFLITDTLYQGIVGAWLSSRIGNNSVQVEKGVIPNKARADQLKAVQDKKAAQLRAAKTGRGIQAKLFKGKNKNTEPVVPVTGTKFDAFERVVLREAGFKRPVVIFGPLADICREMLVGNYSDRYEVARNDMSHPDASAKKRKGIIKLTAINEIIERSKHAVLDITPTAVDKLNYSQLYPIVVFLKAPSAKVVKDLRAKNAVTQNEVRKSAKKMHERATKLERGYNYLFTDVVDLGAPDWFARVHSSIADQQNGLVWVSEKVGTAADEEDEELDQDNDDRLSYVSAPNSDYSVTTIGSEMTRSRMEQQDYESEEEDENAEPFHFQEEEQSVEVTPDQYLNKAKSNMRRVPREPSPQLPPPPVEQPPLDQSSEDEMPQYVQPVQAVHQARNVHQSYNDSYDEDPRNSPHHHQPPPVKNVPKYTQPVKQSPPPQALADRDRMGDSRVSDPAKLPFSQRVNLFKQSQNEQPRSVREPVQQRLGPKPFRARPDQGPYDSGVETRDEPRKNGLPPVQSPPSDEDDETEVVATARGTFDVSGGVLSSVETGVSIVIPRGAIPPGVQQEIYFKVCRDLQDAVPPLDTDRGERLLSPMVMCGPHGLRFNHPVELRLPHCASMTPDGWSFALKSSDAGGNDSNQWQNMQLGDQVGQNSVSVLIDHF